jgi:uncharacterized protein (TIGR02594 family)
MSTTPWLELARNELGTSEVSGKSANPKITQYYADAGHPEVKSDEVSWCSAAACSWVKRSGYPIPPPNVSLLARSWCDHGTKLDAPVVGCIGIWPRGNVSWQGHVAVVEEILEDGKKVRVIGGNQGKGGAVTRATYPTATALAWRMPVKATVADLRKAGSQDIRLGDALQKASVAVTAVSGGVATASTMVSPAEPALDAISDALKNATEHMSIFEKFSMGAANVAKLAIAHPWIFGIGLAAAALALLGWRIKQHRVQRAQSGAPLSAHVNGAS